MKIICFHQSSDLYGSDRSFLQVVEYLVQTHKYSKITVVLPRTGLLVEKLHSLGVEVKLMDLSLLSKTFVKKFQWGKILRPLMKFRQKRNLILQYDAWYVNTSVILDFYLLSPFINKRKILHVREIPAKWLAVLLSKLISKSKSLVIFNSSSTQTAFNTDSEQIVIHNAFEGFPDISSSRVLSSSKKEPLKLLLIGRINSWKGQDFCIEALSKISHENFILKIVGSTSTGNQAILDELKDRVISLKLEDKIFFEDFIQDTKSVYEWCDIVLVPSKKPEPFGRIAIEGMSLGRPVIAAKHGGLPEIIDASCGILFTPNQEDEFNKAVITYLNDRDLLVIHGSAALQVFNQKFSIDGFYRRLNEVFV